MKMAMEIADMFGTDVKHLHGNLYRVRRERIRIARAGVGVEDGQLVYGNPRWFVNKDGNQEARGIDSSKMEELKSSIQGSGLDNPIRLRPVDADGGYLEIVNGERRFRCIESLCEDQAICHDSSSGDSGSADAVYEWIDCRIDEMDDCEALAVALKTNETSEVIGDLASIEVVKALRAAGYDDQDVLKATGKSLSWLRETDRIIGLDDVCLDHFQRDQITRKAALKLALIENAEERLSLLEQIVDIARGRHESKIRDLDKQIEDAEESEIINSAAAEVATKLGEEAEAKKLAAAGSRAKKKVEEARDERQKVSSKPPKADVRDINRVKGKKSKVKDDDSGASRLAGCHKEYVSLIEQIIESEGFDEDGDSLGIDLGILSAVLGVLNAITEGEEDMMSVFMSHCPLVIEGEESEAEEDEYESEDDEDDSESEDEGVEAEAEEDYLEETPAELESEFSQSWGDDEDDD